MKKIVFLIIGFVITNSYAMDCEECWRTERSMSHSMVARISMTETCRKICESQSNLDAGRGYHTDADIAGSTSHDVAQQSQVPMSSTTSNETLDLKHLFVGEWVLSDLDDRENKKKLHIKFEGDNYTVVPDFIDCRSPDRCEVSRVKYSEDELSFTVTKTLGGRSYPQSIIQCNMRLDSNSNDFMSGECDEKQLMTNSREWGSSMKRPLRLFRTNVESDD